MKGREGPGGYQGGSHVQPCKIRPSASPRPGSRARLLSGQRWGLKVTTDAPYRDHLRWIELAVGKSPTHLLFTERPDDKPGETPSAILITPDVGAAYERLTKRGVEFTQAPSPAPWMPGATYALFPRQREQHHHARIALIRAGLKNAVIAAIRTKSAYRRGHGHCRKAYRRPAVKTSRTWISRRL